MIQLGAILAIVAAYPGRFLGLLRFQDNRGLVGLRGIGLLVITSIPASIVGLLAHNFIQEKLFNPLTVAAALAVGGACGSWRSSITARGPGSRGWIRSPGKRP